MRWTGQPVNGPALLELHDSVLGSLSMSFLARVCIQYCGAFSYRFIPMNYPGSKSL